MVSTTIKKIPEEKMTRKILTKIFYRQDFLLKSEGKENKWEKKYPEKIK